MRVLELVVVCVFTGVIPVAAQTETLLLDDAVAEAMMRNPDVAAASLTYTASQWRPVQARSLPDPMVSVGYSDPGRQRPVDGVGGQPATLGVMVRQELPYPGKRQLDASIALREADAQARGVNIVTLDVISRVKQAYFRLAYTYAVEDVINRNRDLLATLLAVSESRYSVGSAAQQDVIKAQTQLSILELQRERMLQERRTREADLRALLGRSPGAVIGRPVDLAATSFALSLDAILADAEQHSPTLQRDQVMVTRNELTLEAAKKAYKPDFGISGGFDYQRAMPAMYELRVDVVVPLQRVRRAAAVAEQQALLSAAQRAVDASRSELQARLTEDYQMTATSARLALLYRDTVLPQARLALESSMASYQTGGVDFLSVLSNFGTVLEYEMTYYDELASYHVAISRLESLAGTTVAH